ncbi:MAG: GNAT family N-acetyltransferase [Pseudomonadota bacterium]
MPPDIRIVEHFPPGAIGSIVTLHARHYAEHWGFGSFFEAKVATELAAFSMRASSDDLVLTATDAEGVCGSLVLDLNDPESGSRGAHLRWFITSDRCRGTGLGRELMTRAMAHADALRDGRAWLTTFRGLDAARHLYEAFGFKLVHEAEGEVWGNKVFEQEFRR